MTAPGKARRRRPVSQITLSHDARARLDQMAQEHDESRSGMVERLIHNAPRHHSAEALVRQLAGHPCSCLSQPAGGDGRLASRCLPCRAREIVGDPVPGAVRIRFSCSDDPA